MTRPPPPSRQRPPRPHEQRREQQLETHEIRGRTYVVAEVDPVDAFGVRTVAVGTGLWLAAFVMLLPFVGRLKADDHLWWLWTCLAGFGLGLAGWDYCRRRRNRLAFLPSVPGAGGRK